MRLEEVNKILANFDDIIKDLLREINISDLSDIEKEDAIRIAEGLYPKHQIFIRSLGYGQIVTKDLHKFIYSCSSKKQVSNFIERLNNLSSVIKFSLRKIISYRNEFLECYISWDF